MIKEMSADELWNSCPTYIKLKASSEKTKLTLIKRYSSVMSDENGYIRVYDSVDSESVVTYLYENGITVSEIKEDKVSLEEYYIDLMKEKNEYEL